jgi:predicted nucleotidyltransferase component of viral defense system
LHQQGIDFELKGGTSLSKGYGIINRFSEDIDIHIRTNFGLQTEGKEDKPEIINFIGSSEYLSHKAARIKTYLPRL